MKYLILILILIVSQITYAVDTDSSSSNSGESSDASKLDIRKEMLEARSLIEQMKYKAAVQKLNSVIGADYRNADAWNLLGYSNRKIGKYKEAGMAYRKALKYNPEHKGALEYQGELFIETKQLGKAYVNRSLLAALCPSGCEELSDLDKALSQSN